jgi:UDP-N-acetylmuramoyl-L-alanyl-D-glutamate--2,6-diaminopimelate ligase
MQVEYCFMEEFSWDSSKRTEALHFVGGVFTNLSHDHLDYHPTLQSIEIKKSFLTTSQNAFVLTNVDDKMVL